MNDATATRLIRAAQESAARIASTKEGREAARLSSGTPALEAITKLLFERDV